MVFFLWTPYRVGREGRIEFHNIAWKLRPQLERADVEPALLFAQILAIALLAFLMFRPPPRWRVQRSFRPPAYTGPMINKSSDFRAQNQILASYKILRGATAEADFQMGWGPKLSAPPTDVIDLNQDGQASFKAVEKDGDGYKNGGSVVFDEPGFAAPRLSQMERVAKERNVEVLTQEDFAQGLYIETVGAEGKDEATPIHRDLRPVNQLVAAFEPWDPEARFAVDLAAGEFVIYKGR